MTKGLHEVVMRSPDRPVLSSNVLEDIQTRLDNQVIQHEPKSSRNNSLNLMNQTDVSKSTLATGAALNQTAFSIIPPVSGTSSPQNSMRNTTSMLDVSQSVMVIPTKKRNKGSSTKKRR